MHHPSFLGWWSKHSRNFYIIFWKHILMIGLSLTLGIHDEETRKMNQEWRNANFGLNTNHFPKIYMRKFYGKDPITWILHMEQFFDLHDVPHTQKV
jgi:hypothetical protein